MVADWEELDVLVAGRPVSVVTTLRFHGRSRAEVAERYGAELVSVGDPQPAGVERIPVEGADERWCGSPSPRAGARRPADRRRPRRRAPVPASWLRYIPDFGAEELRAALHPLLDLPVERVLTSHGDPVLRDGREAIEAALARES